MIAPITDASKRRETLLYVFRLTVFAALYAITARVGLELKPGPEGVPLFWPPLGFGLAAILLWGYRMVPAVFVGALLAELWTLDDFARMAFVATTHTIALTLTAVILDKILSLQTSLERIRDVLFFLLTALLFGTLLTSTNSASAVMVWDFDGPFSIDDFSRAWTTQWVAHSLGMLAVAPVMLVWYSHTKVAWQNYQFLEVLIWVVLFIAISTLILTNWAPTDKLNYPLELTLFPIMSWAAVRFGQRGVSSGIFMFTIMVVSELERVLGPSATNFHTQPPTYLLMFLGVLSLSGLFLGAVFAEYRGREEEVRENEQRLRGIISAMPDLAAVISRNGRILETFSSGTQKHEGLPSLPPGKSMREVLPSESAAALEKAISVALAAGTVEVCEYAVRFEGGERWYEGRLTALDPDLRDKSPVVCLTHEVTVRKHFESELRKAKHVADNANRAKGEFLAVMSHEIRTPMNAILGFTDLLAETDISDKQEDYVSIIRRSGKSLLELINNILDYSKIESRTIELERAPFSLESVLLEALELVLVRAREQGIELDYKLDDGNMVYMGDAYRLRQVILNLVNNAVKFTEKGSVTVEVVAQEPRDGKRLVQFAVIDTGIGIPEHKIDRLFQPFTQADSSTTRQYGGTGLGLVICKRLVEKMGGEIVIESTLGTGSTFSFEVELDLATDNEPLPAGEDDDHLDPKFAESYPLRILLAEDDEINRDLIVQFLKGLGYQPTAVTNGREALDKVREIAFDVLLSDLQMPEMGGLEAARRIRDAECGDDVKDIPIVAVTAFARAEDRDKCFEAGMNAFLAKPIQMGELKKTLRAAAEGKLLRAGPGLT